MNRGADGLVRKRPPWSPADGVSRCDMTSYSVVQGAQIPRSLRRDTTHRGPYGSVPIVNAGGYVNVDLHQARSYHPRGIDGCGLPTDRDGHGIGQLVRSRKHLPRRYRWTRRSETTPPTG